MKKITELTIVKNTFDLLGIEVDTPKTNAKKQVKNLIETGKLKISALSKEEATNMKAHLMQVKVNLEQNKSKMTQEEMEAMVSQLETTATVFDQIAVSTYNYETAQMKEDKEVAKEVAKTIAELTSVFEKEIAAKEKEEINKRIEFIKDFTSKEIAKYDIYPFANDWNKYYNIKFENKTSVNYKQTEKEQEDGTIKIETVISSVKKATKDEIINKLQNFQTAKQVIENHEHKSVLYEYYIKSDYDLEEALEHVKEWKRLKVEEEEREKLRKQKEEEERIRIQERLAEEERLKQEAAEREAKLIEEQKVELETIGEEIQDIEEIDFNPSEENDDPVNIQEEVSELEDLKRQLQMLEMQDVYDNDKVKEINARITALESEEEKCDKVITKVEEVAKMAIYEVVEPNLNDFESNFINAMQTKGVNLVKTTYFLELEESRAAGFENVLRQYKMNLRNNLHRYQTRS